MFPAILEPPEAEKPPYACDPLLWPHLTPEERQRHVGRFWELSHDRQAVVGPAIKHAKKGKA